MAEASISLDQDQFLCPICLDVLKDPVAVPCGHSYCMSCIEGCWDKDDHTGIYSCPQCRQTFTTRPTLGRNTVLTEVVEKLKKSGVMSAPPVHCYAGPGDVACDFCIGEKRKASKSCLVCLASYCDAHLQSHYQVPPLKKHKLVTAIAHLQEKICSHHGKLMEVYCRTDQTCVCYQCSMETHRGHDTVSAAAECLEKQKELGDTHKKYQQRIQERERKLQELRQTMETFTCSAQTALGDGDKLLNEFVHSIERRRSEVNKLMRDQEKAALSRAKEVQERLEQEIAELRKKDAELEQLLHTEDCIHFFQCFQSFCASPDACETSSLSIVPILDFGMMQKVIDELEQRLKGFCSDEWLKFSRAVDIFHGPNPLTETMPTQLDVPQAPEPTTREEFLQYSCKLTLDFNTAHTFLHECNNDPNWVLVMMSGIFEDEYPDHPERFENVQQILCREGLSGRCYWEANWYGTHVGYIAVAYKGIDRKGEGSGSHFVHSDKSWCLKCTINSYSVWHNNVGTAIYPPKVQCRTIGVYLDHRAGTLSFYCVADTMILLHRFQTTFTEPLYPGVGGWGFGDQVRICTPKTTMKEQ